MSQEKQIEQIAHDLHAFYVWRRRPRRLVWAIVCIVALFMVAGGVETLVNLLVVLAREYSH